MNADLESFVPLTYSRRGVQRLATTSAVAHDTTFLVGLSRAFYWKSLLDTGVMKSGSEIAKNEGLHHSAAEFDVVSAQPATGGLAGPAHHH